MPFLMDHHVTYPHLETCIRIYAQSCELQVPTYHIGPTYSVLAIPRGIYLFHGSWNILRVSNFAKQHDQIIQRKYNLPPRMII